MFKVNDKVMYHNDVCIIKDIKENNYNHTLCYVLEPVVDKTLKLEVPVLSNLVRELITLEEVNKIIKMIPDVPVIEVKDSQLETEYRKCLNSNEHIDLVRIIKTAYLRNQNRLLLKKKTSEKDSSYLEKAEKSLYTEFANVLNMNYDDTKKYIFEEVSRLVKE